MKKALLLLIGIIAISCTDQNVLEEPQYTPITFKLVFHSTAAYQWNVNGVDGNTEEYDVSDYDHVKVTLTLDQEANASCCLYKGDYPVQYYVVSCNPGQEYTFEMEVD